MEVGMSDQLFKGYRFLLGPEQLALEPGRRVDSPATYRAWYLGAIVDRGGEAWTTNRKAVARVNHGRWIADCPWCETGMQTRPDWGVAYCAECGAGYERGTVVFPDDHAEIEAVLLTRVKRSQQHWDNRQTLEELVAENERPEVIIP